MAERLFENLRNLILDGVWRHGYKLPGTRIIARDAGVSRWTAVVAIDMPIAEGLAEDRKRSGTYVSWTGQTRAPDHQERVREPAAPTAPFALGLPALTAISKDEKSSLLAQWKDCKEIALEALTDKAEHFDFQVTGIVFSAVAGESHFADAAQPKEFSTLLANERILKVGHNIKASILALRKIGIPLKGPVFDTMLAHYLIEPEASHDLGIIANQYLGVQLSADKEERELAMERVDVALQLRPRLQRELEVRRHSLLSRDIEMPLAGVLASMEAEGVRVDEDTLKWMSEALRKDSEKVHKEIFQLAGQEFNIGSPRQLGEILFDKLKLVDKAKKTKTGQYATGEDVWLKLAPQHAIAGKILEFREYEKLRSTYVDALPRMMSRDDGRIHSDFRQAVAATGRLSSNNPNLQNIPIRTEKGRQIRSAFVPRDKKYLFISADYSQIELRIAASFAKDTTMIEASATSGISTRQRQPKYFTCRWTKSHPTCDGKPKKSTLAFSMAARRLAYRKTSAFPKRRGQKSSSPIFTSSPARP